MYRSFFFFMVLLGHGTLAMPAEAISVDQILNAALQNQQAFSKLTYLSDHIGSRLSGSPALARAIDWAQAQMQDAHLTNVEKQKVMVPVWSRGQESAQIVSPIERELSILGLGGSIATPVPGIEAKVKVVTRFNELGEDAKGKIVLYNVPFTTYFETVRFRVKGASEAAKHGAIGALIRSVTSYSLYTPHTGYMTNQAGVAPIPAAAVTVEDAELIARLSAEHEGVVVRLVMGASLSPEAESANVVGEITGKTDEVVVIGAHLDSWDVGQGAQDDGGGCIAVLEAARILNELKIKPKRTIRFVLFTNEENGLRGATAYFERYKDSLSKHVAALENDLGMDRPTGIEVEIPKTFAKKKLMRSLRRMLDKLKIIGATKLVEGSGGADVGVLAEANVPTMSVNTDEKTYWQIHHSAADTIDKVKPENLNRHVALMATMAYMLAEM